MKTNPDKKTSWGKVASWYEEVVGDKDSYQKTLIAPNILRLLPDIKGKRLLDIGCGEGFFSRVFKEAGAVVTGTDISPELIEKAKKAEERGRQGTEPSRANVRDSKINYVVHKSGDLRSIGNVSFDAAICVLALQNIQELDKTISEVSRVLKPGGHFCIILNHPSFRVPQHSAWDYSEKTNRQQRTVWKYLKEATVKIDMYPGKKPSVFTYSFHRPLQTYVKTLAKHGLPIVNLEEWASHKKSAKGPRERAENEARKEIPLFLALVAKK